MTAVKALEESVTTARLRVPEQEYFLDLVDFKQIFLKFLYPCFRAFLSKSLPQQLRVHDEEYFSSPLKLSRNIDDV